MSLSFVPRGIRFFDNRLSTLPLSVLETRIPYRLPVKLAFPVLLLCTRNSTSTGVPKSRFLDPTVRVAQQLRPGAEIAREAKAKPWPSRHPIVRSWLPLDAFSNDADAELLGDANQPFDPGFFGSAKSAPP
jgi:hypothetical protein